MAEDIVAGLFGISPEQVSAQQRASDEARAAAFAKMDPFERQNYQNYLWGAQIGRGLGGLMGLQDPSVQQAEQQKQIQSQIDHSTPEGLLKGAQLFNQAGNPRLAYMYQQAAASKQAEQANISKTRAQEQLYQAQAEKAGREEDLTKYGRMQKIEVGVEGKPDFRQQALYDPLTGEIKNIGAPYRVGAAIAAEAKAAVAEKKVTETEKKSEKGKNIVSTLTGTLKNYYDELDKLGAIVSTRRGTAENIAAQAMLSGTGQIAGGAIGSQTQKYVNQISATRPLLLNAIKDATGMTAKQMDSNVELQMYLRAATDPKLGYEANIEALSNLDKLYGLGMQTGEQRQFTQPSGVSAPVTRPSGQTPSDLVSAAKAELERRRKGK